MKKPVIGILARPDYNQTGRKVSILYDSIRIMIEKLGGIPIVIVPSTPHYYQKEKPYLSQKLERNENDLDTVLKMCQGVILQGGSSFYDYDQYVVQYLYENNIPTLGICLGMQTMGYSQNGKLKDIEQNREIHYHQKPYCHEVIIQKNSKLYKIIQTERLMVNSRHKEEITQTELSIVGYAPDGTIEAIEDPTKTFFIGVQWHPEDMFEYDIVNGKLLSYFINTCKGEMYGNKGHCSSSRRDPI